MEMVKQYGTAFTEREARTLREVMRSVMEQKDERYRFALNIVDKLDWMIHGIEDADTELTPVIGEIMESPGDAMFSEPKP